MATIYHEYGPGDETYNCPQRRQIRQDSVELRETVRRLSESGIRRESEQRRKSEVISERASVMGSVQSMRQGKLPSNEQLNRVMDRLLSSKSIEANKQHMSSDGQLLLKDFQELLLTFQRALQTKNRDELFQSMIYHVKKSEASLSDIKPGIEGGVQRKEEAKGDAQTGAKAILNIAKLFLFNTQFRGVLSQILNIAQQTMGSVLQEGGKAIGDHADSETTPGSLKDKVRNAASKVTDSKDELSSNDQGNIKGKIRNVAAGIAGGAGASRLASNKHGDDDETDNQRAYQSGESHARDANSHLPKDHQHFLEHRFVDSESSAPATDDAGHTIDQDIQHGAVPHPNNNFVTGSTMKRSLENQSPSQSDGSPTDKQVYLNNSSATQPSAAPTQRAATGAPTVPQHQIFMANPSALQPTATETPAAVRGMPKQASAIPTSTVGDLQRSDSPSSFSDMGKMGNTEHQEFKLEQFYGNHMGVYASDMNKPKPSISGKSAGIAAGIAGAGAGAATAATTTGFLNRNRELRSESPSSFADSGAVGNMDHGEFKPEQFYGNHMGVYDSAIKQPKSRGTQSLEQAPSALSSSNGDAAMRQRLDAAVPKYAPGAQPTSEDYIQSRFDAPAGGGNSLLHKRLNAAVPHSATDADQIHPMSSVGMDGYVPSSHKQSNNMLLDVNRGGASQENNQDFLHKRLETHMTPLVNNSNNSNSSALSPKSHISAGAGYHLNQDNHTVPAKEIVDTLRRPDALGVTTTQQADDQVKAHADRFPGQHVMDKLNFSTAPGGALVNPQQQAVYSNNTASSRQMPQPVQDHANDFSGGHVMDRIDGQSTDSDYSKAGMGATASGLTAGAAAATMLNKKHQQSNPQDHIGMEDPHLLKKFKAGSPVSDNRADYLDKDLASSSHPAETDASTHSFVPTDNNRSAPKLTTKRSSFHEPHQFRGVDGQVHTDDGSSTQPIMSNREAVRRMSSGEGVDLSAHPTKFGSGVGTASALGAGTGAAAAAAAASTRSTEQRSKDVSSDQLDGNTRISADKIVNKVKQKTGNQGQQTENEGEEEQDSISANEIISKLKEIITTVQKNPEYQEAMSTLMSLFNTWGNRLKTGQMDRRRSSAVPVPEQNEYYRNTAAYEAKTIIEDWAQGKSLDPILQQFTEVSSKLKQDDNLKNLMHKIIGYVQKLLQEPGYLSGDESTEEGSKLVDEVRSSALEAYKPQVKSMIQESSVIIKSVSDDPISQKIAEKIKAIHDHLWYDSNGNAAFKPHLLNDMRITLIPALIEQIKFVPLPQIIYSDKQFEIAVENMVLQGDTLMPDIFEVKADDYLRFSPKANVNYTNSQSIHVHMTGIQTTMEDVVFYYRRKTGFPKMSDSGVVSLATGGAGLRVSMRIVSSSVDQRHTFRIDQCHCHIDKLNIKVNHSKHNTLYKVLNPMMTGIVKRQMCKAIENKLITTFEQGDAKITKHLFAKKISSETPSTNNVRRPGLFSHLVTLLNQKVSSI